MPRYTETIDLQKERNRLDKELDELAAESAEYDPGSPRREQLDAQGRRLEKHLAGVMWALNPDDEDDIDPIEKVTVGALTAGEYADLTDTTTADTSAGKTAAGSSQVLFAAKGLEDAPFLEDGANEAQRLSAVSDLQPQFQKWLAARVDELSTYDLEGNGYAARVARNQT